VLQNDKKLDHIGTRTLKGLKSMDEFSIRGDCSFENAHDFVAIPGTVARLVCAVVGGE
jgi:hypothetical protein